MKLNKMSLIFLIAGILLIAGVSLGMARSQQTEQQQTLQKRLVQAKQRLALVTTDDMMTQKNTLTLQVENYSTQIESIKRQLSISEDNISACNTILETAKSYGIDIVGMSSEGISSGKLAGNQCSVLPITIKVEGNVKSISDFVCNLNQQFPTSVVGEVQITSKLPPPTPSAVPSPTPTPTPEPVEATPPPPGFKPIVNPAKNAAASIELLIYSYKDN